ncbi:MAG: YhbY family RNA-binding protein [Spirochaetaceae bacterium]|nr:YhbY family RNA-binding protein [Spirochaetaceae bacterium]
MLTSKRRSFLSAEAAQLPALMQIGKNGPTEALSAQLELLLNRHELVKLRFVDFKDDRKTIASDLAAATGSELVRIIGNTAIFFRQNPDPEKRHPEFL